MKSGRNLLLPHKPTYPLSYLNSQFFIIKLISGLACQRSILIGQFLVIQCITGMYLAVLSPVLDAVARSGRGSSIGSVFAWHASGPEFDPHVRHILSWRLGHEKTFLRPLSLFRWFKKNNCQLLAKECALSTGKLPRRLAKEQCG